MTIERPRDPGYLTLYRLLRNEVLLPRQAQIGYVMAETSDNQPPSLAQASRLLQQKIIEKVAVPDPLPPYDYGYPGPDYCKQTLIGIGVQEDQIITISPDIHVPSMNTQTELTMLTEHLKKTGYKNNLIIIAPWFHTLRSYLTTLSEFKNSDLDIRVFVSSVPLNPFETITHSQGVQRGSRRQIFYEEMEKCQLYNNLISIGEALKIYKEHRSSNSN